MSRISTSSLVRRATKRAVNFAPDRTHSDSSEPVHSWFELSYSNYLCLPRSVLQSMPEEWQRRFVACLEEMDAMTTSAGLEDLPASYKVIAQDEDGKFARDPYAEYERGRRNVFGRAQEL
jgi:hypothetical protein